VKVTGNTVRVELSDGRTILVNALMLLAT
jgi:hypothetical protein